MKGNDLDNRPQPRYFVLADVAYSRKSVTKVEQTGRWRKKSVERTVTAWTPNMAALAELWTFSERLGVRLELVFTDDSVADGPEMWSMLDEAPNPFNDWHVFESRDKLVAQLSHRPDLLGVIDLPTKSGLYGGRGLRLGSLR